MGGAIGVDSRDGEGSTFWFTAVFEPALLSEKQERGRERAAGSTVGAGPGKRGARILVAEDNAATNRIVTLAQLKKLGYEADAVVDGAEAVEAARRGPYGLVLMDCQMPVMDGFGGNAGLIRESIHPDIPIIALTASAMSSDRARCIGEGMNDYPWRNRVDLAPARQMCSPGWLPAWRTNACAAIRRRSPRKKRA